jgi:type IV secretion system protein VirD4
MALYRLPEKKLGLSTIINILVIGAGLVLGLCLATEYTAYRFGFHSDLGEPLFWHIYNPLWFFKWQLTFGSFKGFFPVFMTGYLILIITILSVTSAVWIMVLIARVRDKKTDVHGSAHWATEEEIRSAGLLQKKEGLYLGAIKKENRLEYLRLPQTRNILLFAPSQSGKGVSVVVPNLLSWPYSVLVYDPKGENWIKTAGWREKELGSVTVKLDFTSNDGTSAKFNPLWEVRMGIYEVRDVQNIAGMVVNPDGNGLHDHWVKSAFNFLVGLILHVIYSEREKSLKGVADLITDPERTVEETLEDMLNACHDKDLSRGWVNALTGEPTSTHPTVSSVAREMLNKAPEERSGIVSTALSFLGIYRDPIIAGNTSMSDFRISDLVDHKKPVSLYIIVPESDRDRLRPLVRLILKLISSRLLEKMEFDESGRAKFNNRLLIVLDEFARLRHLEFIEEDMAISLGYGINFLIIVQDISQIYKAYSKEEGITGNCHVRIAYAPNKIETAKELSAMSGVATVVKYAKSFSGGFMNFLFKNVSEGINEIQRPLVTPDEVLRMPSDDSLIFVGNLSPIYGRRIKYFEDPVFQSRSQIKPSDMTGKISVDYSALGFPVATVRGKRKEEVITEYSISIVEDEPQRESKDNFIV